jgi:uncharacterized phage-associated protein
MATSTKKGAYSAKKVAKYLIYLGSQAVIGDNQVREGVTNLKLQKLLYFAQAYYLAKLNRPLFSNRIEAWKYGPVVPDVYREYKNYNSKPIIELKETSGISQEDKKMLQNIWETFGGYSAGRLVDISHAHSPWKEAYESTDNEITKESLAEYYGPLLK